MIFRELLGSWMENKVLFLRVIFTPFLSALYV